MQARGKLGRRLLATVFAAAMIGLGGAQQPNLGVTTTDSAAPFIHQVGRRVTYICPATSPAPSVAVWGTDNYTYDSSVCLAAVHAGVLPLQQAGVVSFVMGPGAASFEGSTRNGVTSAGYGPYQSSFSFDRSGEPGRIDGMTTWRVPASFTTPVTVVCPLLGTFPQPLWGTGTYAADSSICAAAVHAGIIPNAGGSVTVTPGGAQTSFAESTQNGVRSLRYGAWPLSFTVAAVNSIPTTPGTRLTEAAPAAVQSGTVAAVETIPTGPGTRLGEGAPAAVQRGTVAPVPLRYRVTLPGLIVQRPTKDDPLNRDGRGDEIIAAAVVLHFDRKTRQILSRAMRETVEYGDVDAINKAADRIATGTSSAATGGLQAGDVVPRGFAPAASPGAAQDSSFPLKLWEGPLEEGIDGLLIVPSIWERDQVRLSFTAYRQRWLNGDATRTLSEMSLVELESSVRSTVLTRSPGLPTLVTLTDIIAQIIDRPVGLTAAPLTAPYNDRAVVITREKLAGLTAPGSSWEMFIDFAEPATDPVLDGIYRLYLRVERLS